MLYRDYTGLHGHQLLRASKNTITMQGLHGNDGNQHFLASSLVLWLVGFKVWFSFLGFGLGA